MNKSKPVKTALIGSGIYIDNCVNKYNILDIVGCSDIKEERSKKKAEK